jgi:hypothetical protein
MDRWKGMDIKDCKGKKREKKSSHHEPHPSHSGTRKKPNHSTAQEAGTARSPNL